MTRRSLLLAALQTPAIQLDRLRADLEALSRFGRPAGGTFVDGVSRVAFSDSDVEGRRWLRQRMEDAGLRTRIDAAGNLFGRREGRESLPPVLFGSHTDSVPSGGNFDGVLGTLAALEVTRSIARPPRRPLEIVSWASEEGVAFNRGLYGSTAATKGIAPKDLEQQWQGMTLAEAIRRIGGEPGKTAQPWIRKGDYAAYLELHIEQGKKLEQARVPIGIVEGIVAIARHKVTVRGEANHAGTTAMADRRDALVAASELVLKVNEIAAGWPGAQVGTVGALEVRPNAPNVVPGRVEFIIELRDLKAEVLRRMTDELVGESNRVAARRKVAVDFQQKPIRNGVPCDAALMRAFESAAEARGWKTMRLPSGAGHDASNLGPLCPMGMVFVPSVGGLSHTPRELTPWEDCARGAQVLLDVVLAQAERA